MDLGKELIGFGRDHTESGARPESLGSARGLAVPQVKSMGWTYSETSFERRATLITSRIV
jgi:hypothetical protein